MPEAHNTVGALIAAHKAMWQALDEACVATDEAFGTEVLAAAEAAQDKASDATSDALWAIIEHPYSSLDELKRGMAYLVEHHRTTGDGNLGEWLLGIACSLGGVSQEPQR